MISACASFFVHKGHRHQILKGNETRALPETVGHVSKISLPKLHRIY